MRTDTKRADGRRGFSRTVAKFIAGGLAALLFGTGLMTSGGAIAPAAAAEGASLMIAKTVNGTGADRGLRPGDSAEFRVEFRVNDEDADAPVRIVDVLPAAFSGWQITGLTAVVGGSPVGVTLDLPGVAVGASSGSPLSGVLGASEAERTITVGVELPVQAGAGNETVCEQGPASMGCGMPTTHTGVLEYTVVIPQDLSPLATPQGDLVNTATFSAKSGTADLSISDTAIVSVENRAAVGVEPSKTWQPAAQGFQPGAVSTLTIGATQASNVPASALRLQDPADPALTPDGAAALHVENPFAQVDFAGFTGDPRTALPAGADAASVEVYRLHGGGWSWIAWEPSIPNGEIAGVRLAYTGEIEPGAEASQAFAVEQRATHRVTGESLSGGYAISNDVRATVEVPGHDPASKDAEAPFEVRPKRIEVLAQKRFHVLPDGEPTTELREVTVGEPVGVVLRGVNQPAPQSTVLDSLTIAEPGQGSDERFFGDELSFAGFDMSTPELRAAAWPAGASGGSIRWAYDDGSSATVALGDAGSALPDPVLPSGRSLQGFEVVFTGAIEPGAASEIRYRLDSSSAETFVPAGGQSPALRNTIDVTGAKDGLAEDTDNAGATVSYLAPRIEVRLDKRVGPGAVLPGQRVVAQLDTEVQTSGGRTKPTEIVVEDALTGPGTFWDAFDAREILPPISRPVNNGVQSSLVIQAFDGDEWATFATDPDEDRSVPVPSGTLGLRFVYSHPDAFAQISYVKPNIAFTARDTLRSDGSPTAERFDSPQLYENTATAEATGRLDQRIVTGDDEDARRVGIRGADEGTGPGPGGLWAQKAWSHELLTTQSGATAWTTQSWAVTQSGYESVRLQDPQATTASGAGTVFEAFDLTHIRPIRFASGGSNATVDPMLRWDLVSDVQLLNSESSAWESVTPVPGGSWMDADGFKGHQLTAAERERTVGARLILVENTGAREAAHDPADPELTAPAPGSGIAASAEPRSFRLDWQLRDRARTSDGSVKWVKSSEAFNCSERCVDNTFLLTAFPEDGAPVEGADGDSILLMDGTANVDLVKLVRAIDPATGQPTGAAANRVDMVAPNPGDVAQADYPKARYTLATSNSSTAPSGGRGAMKLGKIRVTDTSTHQLDPEPRFDMDGSPFAERDYETEVHGPDGNRFDEFTLLGVSFDALPSYIDTAESSVELWLYDADAVPVQSTRSFSLQQVQAEDTEFLAALPNAIGVAITYSGTDPEANGNRIRVGDDLVAHLDVQLRQHTRLDGERVRGGSADDVRDLPNVAISRGWDAVIDPDKEPTERSEASIGLRSGEVLVDLQKQVSVQHGDTSGRTVYETEPDAPVSVLLTATPLGSTAALDALRIEDATPSFWERFRFVSFGSPRHPTDADAARFEVLVPGDDGAEWTAYADYDGDPGEIRGVSVVFLNASAPDARFPIGTTSWGAASWGAATLPFTVQLRDGAQVEWGDDEERNTAYAYARNSDYPEARDDASASVDFSAGVNRLLVSKRAPNELTHRVDSLASLPWKLVFTNTGTSYLPVERVTDLLPTELGWDGEDPRFTSTPGPSGASGLTADPALIDWRLSDDGRALDFVWPAGARMAPGETMTIELGLILQPMPADEQAVNEVVVTTGVPLDLCEQPDDHGQRPQQPGAANECSNTNFVQPRVGTVIGAVKTVNGEPAETLGENLVSGALDVRTGEECSAGNYLPIGSGYTRNPCASYTAVGAHDSWRLEHINSGTNPLSRMTLVDMLPIPGDKMLAGGAPRSSTFRPVLAADRASELFAVTGPEGMSYAVEVTTDPAACVGAEAGGSLWGGDPECADAGANPGNVWTPLDSYEGAIEQIAGFRIHVDMADRPLPPAGRVVVEFQTVNRVVQQAEQGLSPELAQFAEPQFAWNQNGVIAWDTAGNRVQLPAAPQRAGVTVKTGSLLVSKTVLGDGAEHAPDAFEIELACTVPSGVAEPERVPLDLGDSAVLTVPRDGSIELSGLPIGADCTARERGELGAYGESGRSIEAAQGVTPASDGRSAEIRIREHGDGPTELRLRNTYSLGGLTVEKAVRSTNEHSVPGARSDFRYDFELECLIVGAEQPLVRSFSLKPGEQHTESELPEGAECTLTETRDGGAASTTIAIAGGQTAGVSRDGIMIGAEGAHALVTNAFPGVPKPIEPTKPNPEPPTEPEPEPPVPGEPSTPGTPSEPGSPIETTGAELPPAITVLILLLLLGGGALLLGARRRRAVVEGTDVGNQNSGATPRPRGRDVRPAP